MNRATSPFSADLDCRLSWRDIHKFTQRQWPMTPLSQEEAGLLVCALDEMLGVGRITEAQYIRASGAVLRAMRRVNVA